ncbi:MAG: 4-hydroxy-tetrahydrodipicolinate reductase [Pseudomonadota bacterium]
MSAHDREPLRIALLGATGRMGQQIDVLAKQASDLEVVTRWSRGSDLVSTLQGTDLAMDFTQAHATQILVNGLSQTDCALVTGTTGRDNQQIAAIANLANSRQVFVASNMSIAVNLLHALVERAAAALPGFDIEIAETHHSGKVDAPSGTALTLGHAAASARGLAGWKPGIRGAGQRGSGEIGFSVQRGGNVIGEHSVSFFGGRERLTLSHRAEDRQLFAAGALDAARWLIDQPVGLYGMQDLVASIA